MGDHRSAEERLRAAGFVPSVGTGNPLMRTVYTREGVIGSFIEDAALSMLAREEAAEARGRAQGQREGREAEREDVVDYLDGLETTLYGHAQAAHALSSVEVVDGIRRSLRRGDHVGAAERGEEPKTP